MLMQELYIRLNIPQVVNRYASSKDPLDIRSDIDELL